MLETFFKKGIFSEASQARFTLAQGAGKNNSNLDSTLDYAINMVKQKKNRKEG